MKTRTFDYIKQAPKVPGLRILKPDEPARAGDRFVYLDARELSSSEEDFVSFIQAAACPVSDSGHIRLGRTLKAARLSFNRMIGAGFDGVIYRPLKK